MVPLSTLTSTDSRSGTEFVMRQNLYQCVQINGSAAPGYSSGQAMAALEDVFKKTMPTQMGYDWSGMSYQQQKAAQGVSPSHHLRPVVPGRVPDHGRAIRKLDAAVFGFAGRADRGLWSLRRSLLPQARQRRVRADRAGDADRAVGQERHPHRRIRQDGIRQRRNAARRVADWRQAAPAAHPDDGIRLHPGLRAAVGGYRSRRHFATSSGIGGDRRNARGNHPGNLLHPGFVRCGRAIWHMDSGGKKEEPKPHIPPAPAEGAGDD